MESLKSSMEWDEQTFGLEYDLDVFNIVAVAHAGGAMENKSLNIFSTGLVVASPLTNTDASMEAVMRVIAHECAPCPQWPSEIGTRIETCVRALLLCQVLPQLHREQNHVPRLVSAHSQGGEAAANSSRL